MERRRAETTQGLQRILCVGDLCGDLLLPYGQTKRNLAALREGKTAQMEHMVQPGDAADQSAAAPQSGDTAAQAGVVFQSGGTVANTAVVLGKLGARPVFITDLCKDHIGRFLQAEMEKNGVDLSLAPVSSHAAMLCPAVIEENGERMMFAWVPPGGAYPTFSKESFAPVLYQEDFLIFTGGMCLNNDPDSMEAVYQFVYQMKQRTASRFVFDLNARIESYGLNALRKAYYEKLIALADVVIGSGMEEFGPITGAETLEQAAMRLAAADNKLVIARDGAKPVLIYRSGVEAVQRIPTETVQVIHTVGAGDAFNGGFLYGMQHGWSAEVSVMFANQVAGSVISHAGHLVVE